jgi:chemosensory pili system protein ChpC
MADYLIYLRELPLTSIRLPVMSHSIRSLLIPINGERLLLPSAVVAEITTYYKPTVIREKQPEWFAGVIEWRNQQIPLIILEKIWSLPITDPTGRFRTLVLYGLESPQTLPFYAIITADIPHVLSVNEENLVQIGEEKRVGLVGVVKINQQETAWIPDLTYLENSLRKMV